MTAISTRTLGMRMLFTLTLAGAVWGTFAGSAAAQGTAKSPPPTPALDQYVEIFPSASGPSSTTNGQSRSKSSAPLDPGAATRLEAEGGEDAEVLKKIATQPALGAPEEPLSAEPEAEERSEAATEFTTSEGRQVGLLILLLAGITLAVGGAAGYRVLHRRR